MSKNEALNDLGRSFYNLVASVLIVIIKVIVITVLWNDNMVVMFNLPILSRSTVALILLGYLLFKYKPNYKSAKAPSPTLASITYELCAVLLVSGMILWLNYIL